MYPPSLVLQNEIYTEMLLFHCLKMCFISSVRLRINFAASYLFCTRLKKNPASMLSLSIKILTCVGRVGQRGMFEVWPGAEQDCKMGQLIQSIGPAWGEVLLLAQ
jgi:hypothetical protein